MEHLEVRRLDSGLEIEGRVAAEAVGQEGVGEAEPRPGSLHDYLAERAGAGGNSSRTTQLFPAGRNDALLAVHGSF